MRGASEEEAFRDTLLEANERGYPVEMEVTGVVLDALPPSAPMPSRFG